MAEEDMEEILAQARKAIPAKVVMISGCEDTQTSADVSSVHSFGLPDPHGRAGGALTSALLKVLYEDETTPVTLSFQETLLEVRKVLGGGGFSQNPQLSASRPTNIHKDFTMTPEPFSGTRRALLIGINYTGQQGELRGCQADVHNMVKYIKNVHGFQDEDITLLLDDGKNIEPTKANIEEAYRTLAEEAEPGDAIFCHYSGHGTRVPDQDGDEADGYDEAICPVDFATAGMLTDDEMFKTLVGPLEEHVAVLCIYDCCHSGSILDLPFQYVADGVQEDISFVQGFNFSKLERFRQRFQAWAESEQGQKVIGLIKERRAKRRERRRGAEGGGRRLGGGRLLGKK